MKFLINWIVAVFAVLALGCSGVSQAGIRIDNPDDKEVKFAGYYESNSGRNEIDGVTRATYKVQVSDTGDFIRIALVKADATDTVNELRVKLFYAGRRGIATVTEPGDSAVIEYEVRF
ncbi:hypothetical protein GX441_02615 [bacterium]|nr:hypothetical protein [bacterium]